MTAKILLNLVDSDLYHFAQMATEARFPAFAWKAVACDMMGLPVGSRPTLAQMVNQRNSYTSLWLELTMRFDQMTTVRWAEHWENQEESIHNALQYLGSTPDRITQTFALMGVAGNAMESCDCPLTHYFRGVYGAWFVQVFRSDVFVDFVKCANPNQVEAFIREFDDSRRPDVDMFPDHIAIL